MDKVHRRNDTDKANGDGGEQEDAAHGFFFESESALSLSVLAAIFIEPNWRQCTSAGDP